MGGGEGMASQGIVSTKDGMPKVESILNMFGPNSGAADGGARGRME